MTPDRYERGLPTLTHRRSPRQQHVLWTLERVDEHARMCLWQLSRGQELVFEIEGAVRWTQRFRHEETVSCDRLAASTRERLEADGWWAPTGRDVPSPAVDMTAR